MSRLERLMRRFAAQDTLFAVRPSRLALQKLGRLPCDSEPMMVNVWRNHAFESVGALSEVFATHFGWNLAFRISDYDDSMSFNGYETAAAEVLWLDMERYARSDESLDIGEWLVDRIAALRSRTTAAILIVSWATDERARDALQKASAYDAGVYFADLGATAEAAGLNLLDARLEAVAGTRLAGAMHPVIARELACRWLPAAVLPPVKAVALDLDNTLHEGALGEDGVGGVRLTEAHRALQAYTKDLAARGVFLALVSRNMPEDVEALFQRRDDYPLAYTDFAAVEVSWDDKARALERIAQQLRIATNAVLFVDDNMGELAAVATALDGVHLVAASTDATLTRRSLEYYPGLWRWKQEVEDALRVADLRANRDREALLARAGDPTEYFRSLGAVLVYRKDPLAQLSRLADLCAKTNQFNLALRRLTIAELQQRMKRDDAAVVSIALKDRLSDSGVIGVLVAVRVGEAVIVEELCVSCRALARKLEDAIVLGALQRSALLEGAVRVGFAAREGPRNQPALRWLERLAPARDAESGYAWLDTSVVRSFQEPAGLTLIEDTG